MSGMSGHEAPNKGATDVWLTPPSIIEQLGPFDLDPCAAMQRPWPTAAVHYTEADDGLALPWHGFVWLNPPYSDAWRWLDRLSRHDDGGIALIFARTETVGFHEQVWGKADAISFPRGRFVFFREDGTEGKGNAGAPSCFVAYGGRACDVLRRRSSTDVFISGWAVRGD